MDLLGCLGKIYESLDRLDDAVNPDGGLDVNLQDQDTDTVDLYFNQPLSSFTLATDGTLDATGLSINTPHTGSTGDIVCLREGDRYYQGILLGHSAGRLAIDSPLDYAFTVAGVSGHFGNHNASVNGTAATQRFSICPPVNAKWDIVRLVFHLEDTTVMDDGLFGGRDGLSKGVVLRKVNTTYKNIFNVKTNGELATHASNREYVSKPPAGTGNAMNAWRIFGGQSENGVVLRLDGALQNRLDILVQDDLSGLNVFHIIAQGHVVED